MLISGAVLLGVAVWSVAVSTVARAGGPGPGAPNKPWLTEEVTAVLTHPTADAVLYAGSRRGLFASEDGGQRWQRRLALRGADLHEVSAAPSKPSILYVATSRGLYRSDDAGGHWQLRSGGQGGAATGVLAVAVHPIDSERLAVGTAQGVAMSRDGGASWRSVTLGVEPGTVHAVVYHPMAPDTLYAVADSGVYRSRDGGQGWNRLLVQTAAAPELELEDPAPVPDDETPTLGLNVGSVALDPGTADRLFVGTSRGVWQSDDGGETWRTLPSVGLGHPAIRHLLVTPDDAGRLYAATDHGLFAFSHQWQAWRPITEGIPTLDVRRLSWSSTAHALWVATRVGLMQIPVPQPAGIAAPLPPMTPPARRALEQFAKEPTMTQVRATAIRYAEVMPEKIQSWRARAAWKSWIPHFTLGLNRNTNATIGSSSSGGKTTFTVGPDDHSLTVNYGFTWDLADLIWSTDQTSIDVRSRLMVQLRNDILDEVTRLYFERRRLQVEYALAPVKEPTLQAERQLRLEELTAQIDALTGGEFGPRWQTTSDRPTHTAELGDPVRHERRI